MNRLAEEIIEASLLRIGHPRATRRGHPRKPHGVSHGAGHAERVTRRGAGNWREVAQSADGKLFQTAAHQQIRSAARFP